MFQKQWTNEKCNPKINIPKDLLCELNVAMQRNVTNESVINL